MKNLSVEKFNEKSMTGKVNEKKVLIGSTTTDNVTVTIYQTHEKENQINFSVSIQVDQEKDCKCKCSCKPHVAISDPVKIFEKQSDQVICNSGFSSDDETDVIVSTPMDNKRKRTPMNNQKKKKREDKELLDLFDSLTKSDFEFETEDMWKPCVETQVTDAKVDKVTDDTDDNDDGYVYQTVAVEKVYSQDSTYVRKAFKPHYEKYRATLIPYGDKMYENALKYEPWLVARVEPMIYLGFFAGYCTKNSNDMWLSFVHYTHVRYELSPKALLKDYRTKLSPKTLKMVSEQGLVMGQALYDVGINLEEPYHCKVTETVQRDENNNVLRYFANSVKAFMKRNGVKSNHYKHHIVRHFGLKELN